MLVGAILSPTDPVFASAIVGRNEVPQRLRKLLNIESGLNDGLALPFVLVFLALATGGEVGLGDVALELVLGLVLGIGLPLVIALLLRLPVLGAAPRLQPLGPLALAVVLYTLCHMTHANPYFAAFSAGITLATVAPRVTHAFENFGRDCPINGSGTEEVVGSACLVRVSGRVCDRHRRALVILLLFCSRVCRWTSRRSWTPAPSCGCGPARPRRKRHARGAGRCRGGCMPGT